jgi:hypothetical protein
MEGLRVRLLEKIVFRRIFRPKIKEVTGGWKKIVYTIVCHSS